MRNKLTYIAAFLMLVSFTATKAQVSEPFKNPFPSPLSVAHTWNRSLTKKAGQMLGEQWAKEGMKEVNAPNLTVVQPRYNQCCLNFYGESPYLTAETGVEMVKGLQNKEQLKAFLVFDEKERQAPYVRPYQRVLDEAHAAGIATEAQIQSSANKKTKTLPVSDEFKKTALQVAHESIVLLKNAGNILPVDTAWVKSIAVCGQQELVNDMKVSLEQTLACKVIVTENTEEASKADMIVVFEDDSIDSEATNRLLLTGKPVVMVLLNSHPVKLDNALNASAIIEAWHPGQQGPQAIANVLAGIYNPGGKLTVTFPDFAFGHGLSYTDFRYTNLRLEPNQITPDGSVTVRFNVTNTGNRAGAEVVQVYLTDENSSVKLIEPKLEACKRTNINPGQTKEVKFTIRQRNMVLLNQAGKWVIEPGFFTVKVGGSSDDIRLQGRFEVK